MNTDANPVQRESSLVERVKREWLNVAILVTGIGWFGSEIYYEHRKIGGSLENAWKMYMQETAARRFFPTKFEAIAALLLQAGLAWFTFFSKNRFVTRGHKIVVGWMLGGACFGWIIMLVRYGLTR